MFEFLKRSKPQAAGKAEDPAASAKAHPMLESALEALEVKDDDVVLDIGFGWNLEPMLRLAPSLTRGRLAGIESNPAARERAVKVFKEEFSSFKADFRDAVVSKIPFYDGSFTKVLSLDQMHGWVNLDKAFDEVNRVLAPGGVFVLAWGVPMDKDTQMEGRRIILPQEVEAMLKRAGFMRPQLRERLVSPLHHYQFASRKP